MYAFDNHVITHVQSICTTMVPTLIFNYDMTSILEKILNTSYTYSNMLVLTKPFFNLSKMFV